MVQLPVPSGQRACDGGVLTRFKCSRIARANPELIERGNAIRIGLAAAVRRGPPAIQGPAKCSSECSPHVTKMRLHRSTLGDQHAAFLHRGPCSFGLLLDCWIDNITGSGAIQELEAFPYVNIV